MTWAESQQDRLLAREGSQAPDPAPDCHALTPEGFSIEFQRSIRVFWFIAAGILSGRDGVEDVVQEAALTALDKLAQFEPGTSFVAWMGQMVRYTALNYARKKQREARHLGTFALGQSDSLARAHRSGNDDKRQAGAPSAGAERPDLPLCRSIPSDAHSQSAREGVGSQALRLTSSGTIPENQAVFDDRVVAALNSLSDVARVCLLLRTIEGMEYADIARILNIAPGTAMSHVHRARASMRERLMSSYGSRYLMTEKKK